MYLRALLLGICIAVKGDRPNLSSTVVKQAVINLGGAQYVEHQESVWWIKEHYNIPLWKVVIRRAKLLNRVGGLKPLREEVERLIELEENSSVPYTPPYHLRSNGYLCNQIATYISPPSIVTSTDITEVSNLGQILHEVGCPGIDPAQEYWVKAGNPNTEAGRAARKEIIQFILKHWYSLRMMLIADIHKARD